MNRLHEVRAMKPSEPVDVRRPESHEHECRLCHRVVTDCRLPECSGIRSGVCAGVGCGKRDPLARF